MPRIKFIVLSYLLEYCYEYVKFYLYEFDCLLYDLQYNNITTKTLYLRWCQVKGIYPTESVLDECKTFLNFITIQSNIWLEKYLDLEELNIKYLLNTESTNLNGSHIIILSSFYTNNYNDLELLIAMIAFNKQMNLYQYIKLLPNTMWGKLLDLSTNRIRIYIEEIKPFILFAIKGNYIHKLKFILNSRCNNLFSWINLLGDQLCYKEINLEALYDCECSDKQKKLFAKNSFIKILNINSINPVKISYSHIV